MKRNMNGCIEYLQSIRRVAEGISIEEGTFLITGASGLIGTCMTDALTEACRSLGKRFVIYAMGRSMEKLRARFGADPEVICVAQNAADPISVGKVDYIIHAASNADPRKYALQPVETMLTNVLGAKSVLDYCRGKQTRALLTSSFEVYGKKPDGGEYREEDCGIIDTGVLRNSYPESKRCAEMLFRASFDEYGVNGVIARLSSVYGPTMQPDDSKAHAQFLRNALAGEPIVLKSPGTQRRTYCYVMDAVSGLFRVLLAGKAGETYNIGNTSATIAEVAGEIAGISGTDVVFDLPDDTERKGFSIPQDCVLNTEKTRALGWNPEYDLRRGLEETLAVLRAERDGRGG